jgi:acyl-CoA thioesterase I
MQRHLTAVVLTIALVGCREGARPSNSVVVQRDSVSRLADGRREAPRGDGPTVVFLGTSLTAGLGLQNDEDTYVSRVAELADSAGLPIRAVNAGVSGETSAGGLRRLDWVLREPIDVLVLELGANDGLRGQDPAALEENLMTIIRKTRARYPGTPVVIAGMEAPTNLGVDYVTRFHAVFLRVAEATDSYLIPFLLDGVAGVPELNQEDRIHPTAEGDRVVARNVWSVLETALKEMNAR